MLEYPSGAILALDDLLIDIKVGNTADDPIVARLSQTAKESFHQFSLNDKGKFGEVGAMLDRLFLDLQQVDLSNIEKVKKIVLPNSHFPAKAYQPNRQNNILFVREARKDIWQIVKQNMFDYNDPNYIAGLLVLGSAGVGKTRAAMLVLIGLIQAKKTVIFHSHSQAKAWIFPGEDGSSCRLVISSSINTANVPELDDPSAFYIYDAKAGDGEPVESSAKIIMFSSTNLISYKQTQRRPGVVKVLYPSLSEEEFDFFASELRISSDIVKLIKQIIGHGKVRSLSTPVNQVVAKQSRDLILVKFSSMQARVTFSSLAMSISWTRM